MHHFTLTFPLSMPGIFEFPLRSESLPSGFPKKRKWAISTASTDLTAISSYNLDFAPSRRRVRLEFSDLQQKLDHCLFKLAPAGIRSKEWYERNSRGLEIFSKSWFPESGVQIKGILCFCHGYGDTCTFFFEGVAKQIAAAGYGVYALDYPGFGLSEGLHGYIPSFDELVNDVIEHYRKIKARDEHRGVPHYIFGQSMGGAVAIKIHLKEPHEWDGMILVAPMCKIADDAKPPPPVLYFFTMLAKVMPKAKFMPTKNLADLAIRDLRKKQLALYNVLSYSDPLRLKTAVELLKATNDVESRVSLVSCPLLILHGAADKVTDPSMSQFLFEQCSSADKTLKLYEEGCHCILEGEPDEKILDVLSDIVGWLDGRYYATHLKT